MQREVGCVRIEGFYAREARRMHPAEDADNPLAVAEGKTIRDACPRARRAGVLPGTPVATARRLCAGLVVVPYDPRRARIAAARWMRLGLEHAPWLEPLAPHEAFLDFCGHPDPEAAIRALHAAVTGLGYTARAAVATNKLVARAATLAPDPWKDPVVIVPEGAEAAFLAPHPVCVLWLLSEKTLARLERLEYVNIAEVAASSVTDLKGQVGKDAALVHSLARGIFPDPVRPLFPEETIWRRIRWIEGLERTDDLLAAVEDLAEAAAQSLGGRCCRVLSLTLELEDLSRLEAREMRRMLDRMSLTHTALRLAGRLEPSAPVIGVALVAGALADPPPLEGDLFTLDKIRRQRALSEAVLCLEERYGKRILFPGSEVPIPWRERAWQTFWLRHRGRPGTRDLRPEGPQLRRTPSAQASRVSGLKPQVSP